MKRRLANGHTLGGGESNQSGYTITELLIVVAVTGAMFAGIVAAFSGRQARAQFTQSVREIEASIQKVISDTEKSNSGLDGVSCTWANISNGPVISSDAGASSDGQCTFGGKVLTLGDDGRFQVSNMLIRRDDPTLDYKKRRREDMIFRGDLSSTEQYYIVRSDYVSYYIGNRDRVYVDKIVSLLDSRKELNELFLSRYLLDSATVEPNIRFMYFVEKFFDDTGKVSKNFDTLPGSYFFDSDGEIFYSKGVAICLEEVSGRRASITLNPSGTAFGISMVTEIDIKPGPGDPCYG